MESLFNLKLGKNARKIKKNSEIQSFNKVFICGFLKPKVLGALESHQDTNAELLCSTRREVIILSSCVLSLRQEMIIHSSCINSNGPQVIEFFVMHASIHSVKLIDDF